MAEFKELNGTRSFSPDDTDTKMYLLPFGAMSLDQLIDVVKTKFGEDVNLENVDLEVEHIHCRCLGHDQYDAADYDDFIILEYDSSSRNQFQIAKEGIQS